MNTDAGPIPRLRVAILFARDAQARRSATPGSNRFQDLFTAFASCGIDAVPAPYHDDICDQVRDRLATVDGVLVWINPTEGDRDRTLLDSMLREVADTGVYVSAHPEVILKLGTKDVLYRTRDLGWGCDTHRYRSMEELRHELPMRLASGRARVLKQYRGNGGRGVWKVQLAASRAGDPRGGATAPPERATLVLVRHARPGCHEEAIPLDEFFGRCEQYFAAGGLMIDQEYQERLPEGMVRCYLVQGTVAGFGHQELNALVPAPPGAPPDQAPPPGPRLYHPPTKPEFQTLKERLEQDWVPGAQGRLGIETESLPILWDCDFLLGPKLSSGEDTHVLCEINASSVAPYPESAVPHIVAATRVRVAAARARRGRPRA